MTDTATPETGPVDAPASLESIVAELETGSGAPADSVEAITDELVKEAEETGDADVATQIEEEETETAEDTDPTPEEGTPEGTEEDDQFAKLLAANPDLKVKIKVNGETIEVPLSELPNGYSRTEDYKAKTTAAAEMRREAESVKANAEATAKADYANQLEEATNLFAQFDPVLAEARNINWKALKQADPAAFVQAQDAVNERLNAIQRMNAHVAKVRGEATEHKQKQLLQERAERFDKAADEMVKTRPELADEAKFKDFASTSVQFLKDEGFTQEEIVDALDHRVLRLADDARQWRAHKAALAKLPEKKVVPKSALKPLKSDGSGSSQPRSRFPGHASREAKGNWIAEQILSQE